MTGLELIQKHGYKTNAEAVQAMAAAQTWLSKHRGKRAPIHVQRAVALANEMQELGEAERLRMRALIAKRSRNPRVFFGVVIKGARFERARRWARRTFKLYLSQQQMQEHFASLVPDDFMRYWASADAAVRVKAIDNLADTIVAMYGLADGRSNPHALVPQPRVEDPDLFAPWKVAKAVAWAVVADKMKDHGGI